MEFLCSTDSILALVLIDVALVRGGRLPNEVGVVGSGVDNSHEGRRLCGLYIIVKWGIGYLDRSLGSGSLEGHFRRPRSWSSGGVGTDLNIVAGEWLEVGDLSPRSSDVVAALLDGRSPVGRGHLVFVLGQI